MSHKILWVHTYNYTGSCDPYEGVTIEISNPDVKFVFLQDGSEYKLLKITDDVYTELESDRKVFCEKTNRPLFHDEPFRFKASNMSNVMTFPQPTETETQPRGMVSMIVHKGIFYPDVVGEHVGNITLKDFINIRPNTNIIN